jgi:Fe-S-cluster-containing dehydrogenase component
MKRRDFIKLAASGSVIATAPVATTVRARETAKPLENAVGMLYDSTLCIGCQACVVKCKEVNYMEPKLSSNAGEAGLYEDNDYLADKTLNVIQVYQQGSAERKDQLENGFAYIKRQCMHCVDPNCVSVCPVQALTKNPDNGIVEYNKDVCLGCRNCMVACPFNVPKYEYNNPLGQIQKCELCNQSGVERIDKGQLPGCVEVCPTGAVIFGSREDLLGEAKRRLQFTAGDIEKFPRERVGESDVHEMPAPNYEQHIYGEHEAGGTQVLVLSGIPHASLGLPVLDNEALGARTETLQHGLYKGMMLPVAALAGLLMLARRNTVKQQGSQEDGNE